MSKPFFRQFETPGWQPVEQPSLKDPEWEELFDKGDLEVKTNIANGWLWQFNQEIYRASLTDNDSNFMIRTINEQYKWLRKALPHITDAMFVHAHFDGTAQGLLFRTSRYTPEKMRLARTALEDLWFGDNTTQARGVNNLCYLFEQNVAEDAKRTRPQKTNLLPLVGNLIEDLAWDAYKAQPDNLRLHIQAARMSIWYGQTNASITRNMHPEDAAWHALSKNSQFTIVKFEDVHGHNVLDIVRNTDPVVAADALPFLMRRVRDASRPTGHYHRRLGVAGAVNKKESEITDFDILRTWIPSKTSLWDSAELIGAPYDDVCCAYVTAALAASADAVALPHDLMLN